MVISNFSKDQERTCITTTTIIILLIITIIITIITKSTTRDFNRIILILTCIKVIHQWEQAVTSDLSKECKGILSMSLSKTTRCLTSN